MYKAIIMAAGEGTRISRRVDNRCKCTLDIGGIPLIRHTVEMLLKNNIETHVVVGYRKQEIQNCLKGLKIKFHENIFYSVTNSLVSLWFAREELNCSNIILGNADVFWEENLLSILLNETRDCVMLCDSSRVEQGDYLFRRDKDGRLLGYGKGMDCHKADCEYVGLAMIRGGLIKKCRDKLDEMVENQHHHDWWEQILYSMSAERSIWTRDIAGSFWAEIDFIEDYERILDYRKKTGCK
ncbi:MAG: phosphocholine cytidylyltransferase family protein [Fibromonadaceae bacterium]|nr:phosphocholine cytidylyltransferase family protein [Fibromonadaceae bacterium]